MLPNTNLTLKVSEAVVKIQMTSALQNVPKSYWLELVLRKAKLRLEYNFYHLSKLCKKEIINQYNKRVDLFDIEVHNSEY